MRTNNVIVDYHALLSQEWDYLREQALVPLETFLTTGDKQVVFTKKQYMAIYTRVYNLCIQQIEGFQAELYERYTNSIRSYLDTQVRPRLEHLAGQELLRELDLRWKNHQIMVRWMQRFFQYLDRFYVEMSSIATLHDQGFAQFKTEIFGRMQNPITDAILQEVETDRRNEPIDADQLKQIVSIYSFLSSEKISGASANCLQELRQVVGGFANFLPEPGEPDDCKLHLGRVPAAGGPAPPGGDSASLEVPLLARLRQEAPRRLPRRDSHQVPDSTPQQRGRYLCPVPGEQL